MDIKAVVTDCDGVLTDNGVYYFPGGEVGRKFNVLDGQGFNILHNGGIKTAIVSASASPTIAERALWLNTVYAKSDNKAHWLYTYANYNNLLLEQVAYMGNDTIDLEALLICGFAACPSDAHHEVRAYCETRLDKEKSWGFVSARHGGKGAFREFVDFLISHRFIKF